MKGLLVKDLLVLRKYARTMVVFILVYIVVFSMLDSVDVISGMVTLVLAMMSVATFSYDELAKWDRFGLTMPVSRKQVVASRYLVCLLSTVFGSAITLLSAWYPAFCARQATLRKVCFPPTPSWPWPSCSSA